MTHGAGARRVSEWALTVVWPPPLFQGRGQTTAPLQGRGEDDGDAAAFSGYNKGGGRRRRRGCPSSGLTIVVWSEPVIFGRRHLRYFSTDSHELQFVREL